MGCDEVGEVSPLVPGHLTHCHVVRNVLISRKFIIAKVTLLHSLSRVCLGWHYNTVYIKAHKKVKVSAQP